MNPGRLVRGKERPYGASTSEPWKAGEREGGLTRLVLVNPGRLV